MSLFFKILPLYFLILLGYVAGKKLNVKKESIVSLLIYIIAPVVFFRSAINIDIVPELMLLPVLFFLISTFLCLMTYFYGDFLYKDSTKNLLALSAGTANSGYFGVPVAKELLGEEILGLYILSVVGLTIFEASIGFYIIARGKHSVKESIIRVLKLPTLYAFVLGIIANLNKVTLNPVLDSFTNNFYGAFSVLGMMLVGLGLADLKSLKIDLKFLSYAFLIKFLAWPIIVLSLIYLDKMVFNVFGQDIYEIALLISIVPLAANLVAFATEFNVYPEKAAPAVFLSTVFALIYIPVVFVFLS